MRSRNAKVCHCLVMGVVIAIGGCGQFNPFANGLVPLPTVSGATCVRPPNGCGPAGILADIVPECPLAEACFTDACDAHDLCYRECGIAKSECDNRFLMQMQAECAAVFEEGDPRLDQCNTFAFIYGGAVGLFGNEAFLFVQFLGCACDPAPAARVGELEPCPEVLSLGPPFEDADGDLAPDDWERAIGLDPTDPTDALADYDGDGIGNLVEYLYSSDPFDPSSP